jgi:hypothetical protein
MSIAAHALALPQAPQERHDRSTAHLRLMASLNVRETTDRVFSLSDACPDSFGAGGEGPEGHLEFGYWGFWGIWGLGFGAFSGRYKERARLGFSQSPNFNDSAASSHRQLPATKGTNLHPTPPITNTSTVKPFLSGGRRCALAAGRIASLKIREIPD